MTGRQFTYYCLPEDLDQIQDEAWRDLDITLLVRDARTSGSAGGVVERLRLDYDAMGSESLFLLAVPSVSPSELVWVESGGVRYVDTQQSCVVEVGRCYTDGKILRSSRFWYSQVLLDRSGWQQKSEIFVKWAEKLYRMTKKLLVRDKEIKCWFGPTAFEAYQQKRYSLRR